MANYTSEFPDYHPSGYYFESNRHEATIMMSTSSRTLSTMSQTSQDSGYGSGWPSPREPAPEFDSEFFSPREPVPEIDSRWFPPAGEPADFSFPSLSNGNYLRQGTSPLDDRAPRGCPVPSHSQPGPSKSFKKAHKPTSSSSTSTSTSPKPKSYCCIYPECESMFARAYDLGRHQITRHAHTKRFDCPEENCRRYGMPESRGERGGFTRLDHFRDHVKNLHNKKVVKDKEKDGGQCWVVDPMETDGRLWMRDETGSIRTKGSQGDIWVKNSKTGRWRQIL